MSAGKENRAGPGTAEQVYRALTYRIISGLYPPGSQLPSYRRIADEFGLSRTTVHKVCQTLQEAGYVAIMRGAGVYVAPNLPPGAGDDVYLSDLARSLQELSGQARLLGLPRERLLQMMQRAAESAYGQDGPAIAFVECNQHDTNVLRREVSRTLGLPVEGVLLQHLLAAPDTSRRYEIIITTFFHFHEVAAAVGEGAEVIPVHHRPSSASLLAVARIAPGSTVGVLCINERTARVVAGTVAPFVAGEVIAAALPDTAAVHGVLAKANVIVDSMGCHARVMRLGPKVPVITIDFQIDPESVQQLRHRFGAGAPALQTP